MFQDFVLVGFITLTPGGWRCVGWLDGPPGGHAPASSKAKCPRLAFDSEFVMCKGLAAGNQARISAMPHGEPCRCRARRNIEDVGPACSIKARNARSKSANSRPRSTTPRRAQQHQHRREKPGDRTCPARKRTAESTGAFSAE